MGSDTVITIGAKRNLGNYEQASAEVSIHLEDMLLPDALENLRRMLREALKVAEEVVKEGRR